MASRNDISARLRHRVVLQSPDLVPANGGQFSVEWEDAGAVWAEIRPVDNRSLTGEVVFGEQLVGRISHAVLIRFRKDVSADMRIKFGERYFNIRSVINVDERSEMLRIFAEENSAI
ncbi:MAG: phage head closure protein [Alphaproteobacteria bacterium]|nr:phage head closure protein [Alphaproteobacteria bacterium]